MSKYSSKNWSAILEPKSIEYGYPTRSLSQKLRKIWNTILAHIAYRCPSNKLRITLHRWRGCHIGDNCYIENCIVESRDTIKANTVHTGEVGNTKIVIEKSCRYTL